MFTTDGPTRCSYQEIICIQTALRLSVMLTVTPTPYISHMQPCPNRQEDGSKAKLGVGQAEGNAGT